MLQRFHIHLVVVAMAAATALMSSSCSDAPTEPEDRGVVQIQPQPAELQALWQLSGPGNETTSGSGPAVLLSMATGFYQIDWGYAAGRLTPAPIELTLSANDTISFLGEYEADPFPPALVDSGVVALEQLVANLEGAYEQLAIQPYDEILHQDYLFRIDPNEIGIIGQETFTRAEDYKSTERMFSNQEGEEPVLDEFGQPTGEMQVVPPVSIIRVRLTPVSGSDWALVGGGEFDGTRKRIYEVDMTVTYIGGRVDTIVGKQVFHARQGQIMRGNDPLEVWQLLGWEDLGIGSMTTPRRALPATATSVGALKAMF